MEFTSAIYVYYIAMNRVYRCDLDVQMNVVEGGFVNMCVVYGRRELRSRFYCKLLGVYMFDCGERCIIFF